MYQKIINEFGTIIVLEKDGIRRSFSETVTNSDYEAYLAWLAEGNEPEVVEL